ncbi:alpha/beta hydrolase [Epilithonimonas caeni]|uniref:alpha/beta hydrolase n=1 Tax=Epilithonimonas caeni TaxID=365343 RepID=UPI00041E6C38|nr:alpha/beta hydrolase [Epilithonimonas caeni]
MKTRHYILLVFCLSILSILSYKISKNKDRQDIQLPNISINYNLHKNIVYKKTPGRKDLELDIYQPKKIDNKTPVVIYLHGGAWVRSDKNIVTINFRQYVLSEMVANNYTVISINYTLLNKKTHLDKPLQDCKDVIKWIGENAEAYQLDIDNVGIWGASSGAHLALLTAYNQEPHTYPKLKYAVNFYGPTDLNELFRTDANPVALEIFKLYARGQFMLRHRKILELTGYNIENQKKQAIKECSIYSPLTYVSKETIPTLIFHGTNDDVVDISQSELLKNALENNKIYHKYYIMNNAKHTFSNINLHEAKDIARKTVDFMNSMIKETNSVD